MENEFELQDPAPGLEARRESPDDSELTPNEKLLLVQWGSSKEYDVFLKLSESIITRAETFHFKNWGNHEAFERTGLIAVAMRIFYERLQKEIKHHYEEFAGEIAFAKTEKEVAKTSPEEMIQRGL
jgi:hypothetical protein